MVLNPVEFGNFNNAVSYLSIWGYYVKGFVGDGSCSQKEYEVYNRTQKINKPLAYIYRSGLLKFVEKNISKKDRKFIKKALSGEIKKERASKKKKINLN